MNTERRAAEQKAIVEKGLDNPARLKNFALYSEYTEDVLKRSGEWLLEEEKFQDWMERKSLILWIAGGPGTGKSYLSAYNDIQVEPHLSAGSGTSKSSFSGLFYVKEHDQDLQDLANLLKSIAYQIASVDAVFQGHAIKVLPKPEGNRQSTEDLGEPIPQFLLPLRRHSQCGHDRR
jgi:hypothetical protein